MNSDFAVVSINGNQYVVKEGDVIETDKLENDKVQIEVLLLVTGGKAKFGNPVLKDQKVKFKIVGEPYKGDKVKVFKYKSKSRYRKSMGFRPLYSKVSIESFS